METYQGLSIRRMQSYLKLQEGFVVRVDQNLHKSITQVNFGQKHISISGFLCDVFVRGHLRVPPKLMESVVLGTRQYN